jgi:hypothetical protein
MGARDRLKWSEKKRPSRGGGPRVYDRRDLFFFFCVILVLFGAMFCGTGARFLLSLSLLEIAFAIIRRIEATSLENVTDGVDDSVNASPAFRAAPARRIRDSLIKVELVAAFLAGVSIGDHGMSFRIGRVSLPKHSMHRSDNNQAKVAHGARVIHSTIALS